MGKDSLLKSTSKKKATAKKKGAGKAAAAPKNASAKTASQKAAKGKTKSAPAKKAKKKIEAAAVPKKVVKEPAVAKTAVTAKKVDKPAAKIPVRELLGLKFEAYVPAAPYKPVAEKKDPQALASPPIIAAEDAAEAGRLKALLLEKFDLKAMAAAAAKASQEVRASAPDPTPTPAPKAVPPAATEPETPAPEADPEPEPATEPDAAGAQGVDSAPTGAAAPPPATPADRDVLEGFGGPEPFSKSTILGIVAFAMLVLLIVGASYSNTYKFYLKAGGGGLEIWQGAFAPMGQEKVVTLAGVKAPETIKEVYYKSEVYPLVFGHYLDQADRLLDAPGLPDFEAIKGYLKKASKFASTPESEKVVRIRIDYIDLFILRYKAEVAAAKGTVEDMDAAVAHLAEAGRLTADEAESAEITKRIEYFEAQRAKLVEAQAAKAAAIEAAQAEAQAADEAAAVAKQEAVAAQEGAVKAEETAEKADETAEAAEAK